MEPAQERELVQALEQTHDQMLEREHLDPWSFPYLYDATPEGTDSCVPGLSRLLRTVRETPTFRSVIGKRQVFQNQGCEITDRLLAEWLVERARHTNRPQAVQELTRFLATGDLPCTRVWAISGIMIEGTYEFADDLVLYSWLRLPLDLSNTELTAPGVQPAVVAFTRTETHPILGLTRFRRQFSYAA